MRFRGNDRDYCRGRKRRLQKSKAGQKGERRKRRLPETVKPGRGGGGVAFARTGRRRWRAAGQAPQKTPAVPATNADAEVDHA